MTATPAQLVLQADVIDGSVDERDYRIAVDLAAGADYNASNLAYFGAGAGLITPSTLASFEQLVSAQGGGTGGILANMAESQGANVAASGLWKLSMIINDGTHGRIESHVWGGNDTNPDAARAMLKQLVTRRAACLGNDNIAAEANEKSLGTPQIEFGRINDALNPRVSVPVGIGKDAGFGPKGVSLRVGADFFGTNIQARLIGTTAGGKTRPTTLQFVGQPDAVWDGVRVDYDARMADEAKWVTRALAYVAFLCDPVNKLGFVGVPDGTTPIPMVGFSYNNAVGLWNVNSLGHGLVNNDVVILTGVGKTFNGRWRVLLIDTNNFGLFRGPVAGHPVPKPGFWYKAQANTGTRNLAFYQYTGYRKNVDDSIDLRVSKHNPGRQILPASFRQRGNRAR